jgi:acetylornithine deacetylase/succinyl-diaminopimelate desuccinylase-like protein
MNAYIEENKDRFISEWMDWLRIPSVSADNRHKEDMLKAADWVMARLLEAGADKAERMETGGHPVVYAEKIIDPTKATILIYGHYDVQPPDPLNLWDSPPFEPVIKDGKVFARGACDDKGQAYMHVKALEILTQTKSLPYNLKFLIEGEEEVGSDHLESFLHEHKDLLKADLILVSDTGIFSNDCPTITTGLRGLSYLEVEVTGPNRDLHSGMYGGAVANPINVLSQMIASLHDENGRITIPGFYDKVALVTEEERALMSRVPFVQEEYNKTLDIAREHGEKGYSTIERTSIRPTLDVNGIWGGYTGEGAKTVLPSKAHAKISMRLVPNQSSEEISRLFTEHFLKIAPASVKVKVMPHHGGEPAVTPTTHLGFKAAQEAFKEVWGKEALPMREGGSIPIIALFEQVLGLKTVLLGFGLDSDAIHSPNENFHVWNYLTGIETICAFHKHYAKLLGN